MAITSAATHGKNNAIRLINMTNKNWQVATLRESHMVADDVMSLLFELPGEALFKSGQHVDVRLTAPDGYQAERSYSIANAPENSLGIELGVQILENGEVSPYLFKLKPGKQIEIRGPIGGHFIWDINIPGPLILIGGGSGMVPLMSMLRHYMNHIDDPLSQGSSEAKRQIIFLVSARSVEHVLYKQELDSIAKRAPHIKIIVTLTDKQPEGWTGYSRRIDKEMLQESFKELMQSASKTYICGPNPFVAAVTKNMLALGFDPTTIKTERFGG